MSTCTARFDAQIVAQGLADELRRELDRKLDPKVIEARVIDDLASLLDCPQHVVRALLDGKEVCARVICTLKARVAAGGGLKAARDQRAREWQAIQQRQDEAMRQLKKTRASWPRWTREEL